MRKRKKVIRSFLIRRGELMWIGRIFLIYLELMLEWEVFLGVGNVVSGLVLM